METVNNSILYWKWDDEIFNTNLLDKIEDICSRTEIHSIFIALHWVKRSIWDQELIEKIKFCGRELHNRGRKLYVEVCPRKEGAEFFKKHPNQVPFLTTATEIPLDHLGYGNTRIRTESISHFWRTNSNIEDQVLTAYTMVKDGDNGFVGGTLKNIKSSVTIDNETTLNNGEKYLNIFVDAGEDHRNKTAVVFIGIPQAIPELASKDLPRFFGEMLDNFSVGDMDGVCSDEWGYDVWIRLSEEDSKGKGSQQWKDYFFEHVTYSKNFDGLYKKFGGSPLIDDLIYFFYIEDGNTEKSIEKVNLYHKTFRSIMRKNDEDMYELTKGKLGHDTFFGVHPTWWGNNYLENFEGFKNGFYWWEAKRDIAQTDEIVIMPIRTALAHKWKSPIWYNMWYSMGTRDIDTYYEETWNNVRYGGRTHYLAYECPNESVVLELKPKGMLESIEKMDAIVRSIDPYQKSQPDSRVLVLFGIENALNWYFNDEKRPPWYPRHKVLSQVLECTDRIFDSYLCDLVPTSEIENGSLSIDGDRARYGNQIYDAVILLAPDSMGKICYDFLSGINRERLVVAGDYNIYSDGKEISPSHKAILDGGIGLDEIFCPNEIIRILDNWNIKRNRFKNGCILQDGSLIFTGEGKKAIENELVVNVAYKDKIIDFKGEDMLYLHRDGDKFKAIYPKGKLNIKNRMAKEKKDKEKDEELK